MNKTAKARNRGLDLLRIIATCLILLHHYQQLVLIETNNSSAFKGVKFYGGNFYFGWVVEFFFILSGYVIASYEYRLQECFVDPKDFLIKRWQRFFPTMQLSSICFEIILILRNMINRTLWYSSLNVWGTLVTCLGLQEGWGIANPMINNPLWYISVLLICYVIFVIVIILGSRMKISVSYFYCFIILLGIGIRTYSINLPFLSGQVGRGYYSFFFGLLLYKYKETILCENKILPRVLIFLFLTGIIVYYPAILGDDINYFLTFVYYPNLILIFENERIRYFFSNFRIIDHIGKITFNIYAWHINSFYILLIFKQIFFNPLNLYSRKLMMIYIALSMFIGFLTTCIDRNIKDKTLMQKENK